MATQIKINTSYPVALTPGRYRAETPCIVTLCRRNFASDSAIKINTQVFKTGEEFTVTETVNGHFWGLECPVDRNFDTVEAIVSRMPADTVTE